MIWALNAAGEPSKWWRPAAYSPPISASSTTPTPPGVIGAAESRRANANTARAWAQVTSLGWTPTKRRERSRTQNRAT